MGEPPITRGAEAQAYIKVPVSTVDIVIVALRTGAEAVLDRDWAMFTARERREAEQFVQQIFHEPANTLEKLSASQFENPDELG